MKRSIRRPRRLRVHAAAACVLASTCGVPPTAAAEPAPIPYTATAGGYIPLDNQQPVLALTQYVETRGPYPSPSPYGGGSSVGIGAIRTFAGNFAPDGSPFADGAVLPIRYSTALFSILGTTFGGDGRNSFALPDLGGRLAVHVGSGTVSAGAVFGQDNTMLTAAQMPAHAHAMPDPDPGRQAITGLAGSGRPVSNVQASLGVNYLVALRGALPTPSGSGGLPGTFVGRVTPFAGTFAPEGFAFVDGQTLSIEGNEALFSLIGTRYGGDGITTFALPDLRGRTIVGTDTRPGDSTINPGQAVGTAEIVLTPAQLPAHVHGLVDSPAQTGVSGGTQPFDNRQPSLALTYLIATNGAYPVYDCCSSGERMPILGEITAFVGDVAPDGWMFADGRALPIATNTALFSVLGTTYGGDGLRTFALPDLRGRAVVGTDATHWLGSRSGSTRSFLIPQQMPMHSHTVPVPEPGTWALMLAGLTLVGGLATRRGRRMEQG